MAKKGKKMELLNMAGFLFFHLTTSFIFFRWDFWEIESSFEAEISEKF